MIIFERFILLLIMLAILCATGLGLGLSYLFSRYSPDKDISRKTLTTYATGIILIAFFALVSAFLL